MKRSPDLDRTFELAALRAVEGLGDAEERELQGSAGGAELAVELEAAAAAVHVAFARTEPLSPPMPEGLADRLLARAMNESALARRAAPRRGADGVGGRVAVSASPSPSADGPHATGEQSRGARPSLAAWSGWVLAAASIGLCVFLAGRNARLQEALRLGDPGLRRDRLVAEAPDAAVLDWTALTHESARGLAGRVTWSDTRNEGYMTFRGLAPNDPSKLQYQLWIFRGTDLAAEPHPVDGGVFDVPPGGGEVVVPIDAKLAVGRAATFVVTVEPPGGVVVSDRSKLVALAQRAI